MKPSTTITLAKTLVIFLSLLSFSRAATPDSLVFTLPNNIPLVLIKIPAGSFMMGSNETAGSDWNTCEWNPPCDKPVHKVTFDYSFYVGKYEVTQEQWVAIMDTNPSSSYLMGKCLTCPVEHVSWNDCQIFCKKVTNFVKTGTFRLPSESEWEYACRAGTTTRYFFGDTGCTPTGLDSCLLNQYAWWSNNNPGAVQPVGRKKPNPWGLYDVIGNVYEWCQDNFHFSYEGAPTDGSPWLTDSIGWKSIRGAWRGYFEPRKFTSAFRARHENYYDFRHDCCGMRIAFVTNSPDHIQKYTYRGNTSSSILKCTKTGKGLFVFSAAEQSPVHIYNLKGVCIAKIPLAAVQGEFRGTWEPGNNSHSQAETAFYIACQAGDTKRSLILAAIR